MAPKPKDSEAGNSDMAEQPWSTSCKWKYESSQFNRKKSYAEVVKIYGKNVHESVKKEKETLVDFAVAPQTAKVTATVYDKYLVKTGMTLKLW